MKKLLALITIVVVMITFTAVSVIAKPVHVSVSNSIWFECQQEYIDVTGTLIMQYRIQHHNEGEYYKVHFKGVTRLLSIVGQESIMDYDVTRSFKGFLTLNGLLPAYRDFNLVFYFETGGALIVTMRMYSDDGVTISNTLFQYNEASTSCGIHQ